MNIKTKQNVPQIESRMDFNHNPDIQVEWTHVGVWHVTIMHSEVSFFLEHPDELKRQLIQALELMDNKGVVDGYDMWKRCSPHAFQIMRGLHYPMTDGYWSHEGERDNSYLTITEVNPLKDWELVGLSHYIRLDKHERALQNNLLDIRGLISEQVERGVSQGVAKAIQESTANLKQVHTEKQRIDQQIAELQRERERVEAIEKRLEEKEAQKQARKSQPKSRAGCVYIVRSLTAIEYFKIGRSATPEKRMKQFEVNLPFEIEPICLIQTDDMYDLESELHQRFADKRAGGEFFLLTKSDLDYIKSLGGAS